MEEIAKQLVWLNASKDSYSHCCVRCSVVSDSLRPHGL